MSQENNLNKNVANRVIEIKLQQNFLHHFNF